MNSGILAVVKVQPEQDKACSAPERIQNRVQVRVTRHRSRDGNLGNMYRSNEQQVDLFSTNKQKHEHVGVGKVSKKVNTWSNGIT